MAPSGLNQALSFRVDRARVARRRGGEVSFTGTRATAAFQQRFIEQCLVPEKVELLVDVPKGEVSSRNPAAGLPSSCAPRADFQEDF